MVSKVSAAPTLSRISFHFCFSNCPSLGAKPDPQWDKLIRFPVAQYIYQKLLWKTTSIVTTASTQASTKEYCIRHKTTWHSQMYIAFASYLFSDWPFLAGISNRRGPLIDHNMVGGAYRRNIGAYVFANFISYLFFQLTPFGGVYSRTTMRYIELICRPVAQYARGGLSHGGHWPSTF